MLAAQTLEVGRVGEAQRVGHGVIDVAEFGGSVATREPAGQIAAPDKALQLGRGAVPRLWWAIAGMAYWLDGGAAGDQLGQQRCGQRGAADDPGRRQSDRRGFGV